MSSAIKRLSTEHRNLQKEEKRVCDIYAEPLEDNIFEWHFTVLGAPESESFQKGIYHGVLLFSREYPFSPPDILFLTPNGRFELKTKICSSISSFHPEAWRPSYDVPFILQALRLFMAQEDENGVGTIHKTNVSVEEKKRLATASWDFECPICAAKMKVLWEERLSMYPATSGEALANVPSRPAAAVAAAQAAEAAESSTDQPQPQQQEATTASTASQDNDSHAVQKEKQEEEHTTPAAPPVVDGEADTKNAVESKAEDTTVASTTTAATSIDTADLPPLPTTTTQVAPPAPAAGGDEQQPQQQQQQHQEEVQQVPEEQPQHGIVVEVAGFDLHISVKTLDRMILFFLSVSALILLRRFVVYMIL